MALLGLPMATYASVGALVARRTPRNPIGWLFSAVGLAIAIWLFGLAYAAIGMDPGAGIGDLPGAAVAAWAGVVSLIGVLPIALPLFLLYFPDGRLPSRRWRPVLWAVGLGGVLLVVGTIGHSWVFDPIFLFPPGWTRHLPGIEQAYIAGLIVAIATSFAGLLALILRFRGSSTEQRQPLRMLVAVIVAMARHDRARDRDRPRVAGRGMVLDRDRPRDPHRRLRGPGRDPARHGGRGAHVRALRRRRGDEEDRRLRRPRRLLRAPARHPQPPPLALGVHRLAGCRRSRRSRAARHADRHRGGRVRARARPHVPADEAVRPAAGVRAAVDALRGDGRVLRTPG